MSKVPFQAVVIMNEGQGHHEGQAISGAVPKSSQVYTITQGGKHGYQGGMDKENRSRTNNAKRFASENVGMSSYALQSPNSSESIQSGNVNSMWRGQHAQNQNPSSLSK